MIGSGFLLTSLILAGLGALLMLAALIPRRVDDHPLCAACGFNLVGHPEPNLCPECGRTGLHTIPIIIGHRRRALGLLWAAVPLLVVGLAGTSTIVTVQNTQSLKPLWWLKAEAASPSWQIHFPAMRELERRIRLGALAPAQIDELANLAINRLKLDPMTAGAVGTLLQSGAMTPEGRAAAVRQILAIHADRSARWADDLSLLLSNDFRTGLLSPAEYAAYARNSINLEWRVPTAGDGSLFVWRRGDTGSFEASLQSPCLHVQPSLDRFPDGLDLRRSPEQLRSSILPTGPLAPSADGRLGVLTLTLHPEWMPTTTFTGSGVSSGESGTSQPLVKPPALATIPITLFQPPASDASQPRSAVEAIWRRRLRPTMVMIGDSTYGDAEATFLVPRPSDVGDYKVLLDVRKDGARTTIAQGQLRFGKNGQFTTVFGSSTFGGTTGRATIPADEEVRIHIPWAVIDRPRLDLVFSIAPEATAGAPIIDDFPPFEAVLPGVLFRPDLKPAWEADAGL